MHGNDAWRLSMAKPLKVQIIERAKDEAIEAM
jgi:hypothetical protein